MTGNDSRTTVTPRLRFPEFRGQWTTIALHRIAELVTVRVGSTQCTPYTVTSGVGLVSQEEKLGRTIAGKSISNYVLLRKNDFAYNKSATKAFPQGFIARFVGEERAAVPNSIFTYFRVDDGTVNPIYLGYLFSSNLHGKWLRNFVMVGARADGSLNVNNDDLLALPVPLPDGAASLAEQQRIAECLTSLDEVIAAQARKVEALKVYKWGLMQQLFPREGETVPRLRFPEFRYGPEWRIVPLCDLLVRKPGYGVNARAVPYSKKLPAYLRITDIDHDGRFIPAGKVSVNIDATDEYLLSDGDIVVARTGGSVGKSYRYKSEDGPLIFAGFLIRLKPDKEKTVPSFLSNFLSTQRYWDWVRVTSARSGQPGLNGNEFASLAVPVPPSDSVANEVAEQQRLADSLDSLDSQIAAESDKLNTLKSHKSGLMQQLFPVTDGIG